MTAPVVMQHIRYCDECHDLIQPGEPHYALGGRIICATCWGKP